MGVNFDHNGKVRRIVIVVPDLLGDPADESALRQRLSSLEGLAEIGTLFKIAALPRLETPEALYLGLRPTEAQMRQGPLTVSALGADPPERSTHFHLSLLTYDDGRASQPGYLPTPAELDQLWSSAVRLNTSLLTLVKGEGWDHGLVWEALGDLGTTPASEIEGKLLSDGLPEGDGDRVLRRLIDDSVNLLSDLELNRRRTEEGLPTFNLLWPWGHGTRQPVPNLLLRRGELATVESGSLRLAGLTRLTGYRHEARSAFGQGTNTRFAALANRARKRTISLVYLDAFRELREAGRRSEDKTEEVHWLAREFDAQLLRPLLEDIRDTSVLHEPTRLTLLAPAAEPDRVGLGLVVRSDQRSANAFPFDERALEERMLPTFDLQAQVEAGLIL